MQFGNFRSELSGLRSTDYVHIDKLGEIEIGPRMTRLENSPSVWVRQKSRYEFQHLVDRGVFAQHDGTAMITLGALFNTLELVFEAEGRLLEVEEARIPLESSALAAHPAVSSRVAP